MTIDFGPYFSTPGIGVFRGCSCLRQSQAVAGSRRLWQAGSRKQLQAGAGSRKQSQAVVHSRRQSASLQSGSIQWPIYQSAEQHSSFLSL